MPVSDTIIANPVAGLIVAIAVAIIGLVIARSYTEQQEAAHARRERDLAVRRRAMRNLRRYDA